MNIINLGTEVEIELERRMYPFPLKEERKVKFCLFPTLIILEAYSGKFVFSICQAVGSQHTL